MLNIGCHLSASKGYLHMGREAAAIGANTFQFFTRNPRGGSAKKIDSSVSNITEGNVFVVSGILNAFKNLLTYRDELMFGKDTFLCLKINDYFEIYEWKKQKFIRVDKVSEYLSANYRDLKTYSVY